MAVDVIIMMRHHVGLMWAVAMAMIWRQLWVIMRRLRWVDELPQFGPGVGNHWGAPWQQWRSHDGSGGSR